MFNKHILSAHAGRIFVFGNPKEGDPTGLGHEPAGTQRTSVEGHVSERYCR